MDTKAIVKQVVLRANRYEIPVAVDTHVFASMKTSTVNDFMADKLLHFLSVEVLSERLADKTATLSIEIPQTWWDHLRHDHFPAAVNKRWPPKMITISKTFQFELDREYPDAPPLSQFQRHGLVCRVIGG